MKKKIAELLASKIEQLDVEKVRTIIRSSAQSGYGRLCISLFSAGKKHFEKLLI